MEKTGGLPGALVSMLSLANTLLDTFLRRVLCLSCEPPSVLDFLHEVSPQFLSRLNLYIPSGIGVGVGCLPVMTQSYQSLSQYSLSRSQFGAIL